MSRSVEQRLSSKLFELPSLQAQLLEWQQHGEKVVFTNGVFDLIHIGHISYLAKAAELGHKLVIGLNSDDSVKRLKGPTRPVNNQHSRAMLLAAFFYIDAIVIFDEDTPQKLISILLPDVLVKGADYQIENIAGAKEVLANGGEVKTITFVDGYSSTAIINKIKG
jgi:rfaE bifunctional protein nucleotidyltransferase chain/domain